MAIDIDERIEQFINSHRVAHLATADASGEPLIVPICFAFDGACFFTAIDEKPKAVSASTLGRLQNIRANPRVALLLDDYSEDWTQLAYLLIKGTARIIDPPAGAGVEHAAGITLLRARYTQYRSMAIDQNPLIRIEPRRLKFWSAA
jgi:PPOX class probable F420-dependent enzyme